MTSLIDEIIASIHSNLNTDNVLQALKSYGKGVWSLKYTDV